jgi:Xaa-Pro aminopeptidase
MVTRRFEDVQRRIVESRLQGFLVTFLPNIYYLTGFTGSHAVLVMRQGKSMLFTDARYISQAKAEVKDLGVCIAAGSLFEAVQKKGLIKRKERFGIEADSLLLSHFEKLKHLFHQTVLVQTKSLVEQIRIRKDEVEISKIRRAVQITDKVFDKILGILKPGIRELEIAAEISYWHRSYGAESDAFEPIVASGIRGAMPHGRASDKKIRRGEMVTIDLGCRVEGYQSDLTRTIAVGKPPDELKRMHHIVRDAQQQAVEMATSGIAASTLDGIARRGIRLNGYGKFFSHSLGHGLGLEVHELPHVSVRSKDILDENCVITIEPGVYVPGLGGVRIEDDVVIRRGGCELLNKSPRELIVL